MTKIVQFNKQAKEEEFCECPYCHLRDFFVERIQEAESLEELESMVNEVIQLAKEEGQREVIVSQLRSNVHFLKHLDGDVCEDCCEECCDGECDCGFDE